MQFDEEEHGQKMVVLRLQESYLRERLSYVNGENDVDEPSVATIYAQLGLRLVLFHSVNAHKYKHWYFRF